MKRTGYLILVIMLLGVSLSPTGAQENADRLDSCAADDIAILMDALQPVIEALAAADDSRPEAKLDWVQLPLDDFVRLSFLYVSADDMLAASVGIFPNCADSTILVSLYDALLNDLTLWATEMALYHTYQTDPDDVGDASSFKANAIFHMEQAEKTAAAIGIHTDNLSEGKLIPDIPACSDEELAGDYARFLSMTEMSVPLTMGQIDLEIGPTSRQLLTIDSFNMTLLDMPPRLPYPVPECVELKLQTITQYTELADLAIFGVLAKLAAHLDEAGDTEAAVALAAIVETRQDAVMVLFEKWGGQVAPENSTG
ncbi:MAG: hypothetical protein JXQ72_09405 [Anaerolineae bacterium]|nr:hypothetical protein [Anaerolineae bacterium]